MDCCNNFDKQIFKEVVKNKTQMESILPNNLIKNIFRIYIKTEHAAPNDSDVKG